MQKKNRSYVLSSVVSKDGSWNNNNNGVPKRFGETYFASDRAYKYAVRRYLEAQGEEVLIRKWIKHIDDVEIYKDKKGKEIKEPNRVLATMSTKEIEKLLDSKNISIERDFWSFKDVRNFGMLLNGVAIHGVVQMTNGIDRFGAGFEYDDDVTSVMVFEKKNNASEQTTAFNSKVRLSEAHFVYETTVEPANLNVFDNIEAFKDCKYSQEDYEQLLEGLEYGPRIVKSTQKSNCFTGFMFQIDLVEGSKLQFGDLIRKVQVTSNEGELPKYDIDQLVDYLVTKAKGNLSVYETLKLKYDKYALTIENLEEIKTKLPQLIVEEI